MKDREQKRKKTTKSLKAILKITFFHRKKKRKQIKFKTMNAAFSLYLDEHFFFLNESLWFFSFRTIDLKCAILQPKRKQLKNYKSFIMF